MTTGKYIDKHSSKSFTPHNFGQDNVNRLDTSESFVAEILRRVVRIEKKIDTIDTILKKRDFHD